MKFPPSDATDPLETGWRSSPAPGAAAPTDPTLLAAGLVHDLSNALNAIAGWARLAREGHRSGEALEIIEQSAIQSGQLAQHMLANLTGKPAPPVDEQSIDVGQTLQQVASLLIPAARQAQVQISLTIEPKQYVVGARSDLWTLCWNLALNAVQAMLPAGGRLWLRATHMNHLGPAVVRLEIEDDGPGMPPDLQAQVLEPYVTTRPTGHGLGLAMVVRAAHRLRGRLVLQRTSGRGTCWSIDIPACAVPGHAAPRAPAPRSLFSSVTFPLAPRMPARVLVVDDDDAIRDLVTTALSMQGAEVVSARGLEPALAAAGTFDLAIIDMLLSDAPGDRVLAQLRQQGQVRRALMMSGLEPPAEVSSDGQPQVWLRKPFQLDVLFQHIEALLTAE